MATKNNTLERERTTRVLGKVMLALGAILLISGLGWTLANLKSELHPVHDTNAGAVVLAATASPTPSAVASATAAPSPVPAVTATVGPGPEPTPTAGATATPAATATPTRTPTSTPADPPTRIVAPSIHLDAPITRMGWRTINYKGKSWNEWVVPKNSAGWLITSAPPGQVGNTVVSGHHNIDSKVFRYVVDLKVGDKVTLYSGNQQFVYVVTQKYILKEAGMPAAVRHKNAQWIAPTNDNRLTLVTCWPYNWPGNTHRVIVVAMPVGPAEPAG